MAFFGLRTFTLADSASTRRDSAFTSLAVGIVGGEPFMHPHLLDMLAEVDAGRISQEELFAHAEALMKARIAGSGAAHQPPELKGTRVVTTPTADAPPRPAHADTPAGSAP